jgi:HK97 gp10 family phage protein
MNENDGFVRPRMKRNRLGFEYGSNVKYASFLEYGTARMKARPYISPVMAAVEPRALGIIAKAMRKTLRDAR